jgi:WD40 repeat protein/serine/threonine protein kinase
MPRSIDVEELFDDFLARLEEGATEDFEEFSARHPEHASELRQLYESWSRMDAELESALPEPVIDESFFHGTEPGQGLGEEHPVAPPATAGTIVADDYRLLRLIGQGGMGHVWEAEQLSLGRRVALKLVRPGRGNPGDPEALTREARAGGRLNHPGIVTVYAAGSADGVHYIAQELVGEGFTLADFIERRRTEPLADARAYRKLAELFAQVAEAVHIAHEASILHRDLKPSNILIGTGDKPVVSDFGLAHLSSDSNRSARPGLLGTYAYMSPEQATGRDIAIDRRSDVFSLGAVFYEALTLRRAFEGDTGDQILDQVVGVDPPDARVIRSRIPRDLAVICQAALAKNRAVRYQSMAAFAADLRRFLTDEPIEAQPQDVLTRSLKWCRRHPAWTTAVGLVSLALVIITSLLLNEVTLRQEADASSQLAEQRSDELVRQSYLANVRLAVMRLGQGRDADDVEARAMLADCVEDQRGWEWRHYSLAADLSLLHLRGHTGPVVSVASDASGERLLTGSDDGTVRLWDGSSGETLAVLQGSGAGVSAVSLSADSATLVGAYRDNSVTVWSATPPYAATSLEPSDSPIATLSCSADGRLVAGADEHGGVLLWNLVDGTRASVPPGSSAYQLSMQISADGSRLVTGSRYGQIHYYDLTEGALDLINDWLFEASLQDAVSVSIVADGSRILAGLADGTVLSWSGDHSGDVVFDLEDDAVGTLMLAPQSYELRQTDAVPPTVGLWPTGEPPTQEVQLPVVSGRSLNVSVDDDGNLLVEYPEPSLDTVSLKGHAGAVHALVVSGDERRLVSASHEDGSLRIWDVVAAAEVIRLTGHQGEVHALAMSLDGSRILAGCGAQDAVVWLGDTRGASIALPPLDNAANALAISDDGDVLLSGSILENVARVWDGVTGEQRLTLSGHSRGVTSLAMNADGAYFVTGSYDSHVRVWDGATGGLVAVLEGHQARTGITSVAIDDAGLMVVSGSHDKTLRIWNVPSSETRKTLTGSRSPITSVALSGAGKVVAAGSEDGTVRVWEQPWDTERVLREGTWADDGSISLSRDGTRLAWASARNDEVIVWETATGTEVARLTGTRSHVVAADLSDDGQRLLWTSAGDDGVRLLHVDTGEMRAVLPGHAGPVTAVAFGESSGRIVTADRTGHLRIWESDARRAQALWTGRHSRR